MFTLQYIEPNSQSTYVYIQYIEPNSQNTNVYIQYIEPNSQNTNVYITVHKAKRREYKCLHHSI